MDKNVFATNKQINEVSYRTINYPTTIPIISTQNRFNINNNMKNSILFHFKTHRPSINNKKDFFFDEDDTKNNENFKIFMDNLLNKDESSTTLDTKNFLNSDNSCIHSNKQFFLKKINQKNNKYDIKKNLFIKEDDIYYSFQDNKLKNKSSTKINNDFFQFQYKLKYFLSSVPKKCRKHLIYNKDCKYNNDLEFNNYYDSTNNFLQSFNTEKKNIGINCKMSDYFLKNKKTFINDNISKLAQTFSLKEIDGKTLNNIETENIEKKYKKYKKYKNNSFNHIKKCIPENKIPKIIFFSRNNDKKDKETKHKLNTLKEKAYHFLKDKSTYSLISKNSYKTNFNEKTELTNYNNNYFSKNSNSPINKLKLIYSNERNIMPFLKIFEKNYKKKMKKKKMNINKNKKSMFSSLKNNYYNNNIKCLTFNNIK